VRVQGRSGLMDVALHPQFATNRFVYFSYLKPTAVERQAARDRRARAVRWIRDLRANGHLQFAGLALVARRVSPGGVTAVSI
jgi:glucose/arabinose dehydrogenase